MKVDATKLGLATGIVFAVIWIICSVLVALLPGAMMRMGGAMMHADMVNYAWSMHWGGFIIGLVLWTVLPALIVWAVATVYNRLID